jgi:ABC-type dipeptide/oligopeptide/nickel transport system permease component
MSEQVDKLVQQESYVKFYINWFIHAIFKQDFGSSITDGRLISESLWYSAWISFKLTSGALVLTILISISNGFLTFKFPESKLIRASNGIISALSGFHTVVLGVITNKIFGLYYVNNDVGFIPLMILAIGNGALQDATQYITQALKNIYNSDYIRAAKARGGNIWKNIFNELAIHILTLINSRFPYLIGGAFVVEYFFNINKGLGMQIITGVKNKEALLLMSFTLIVAASVLILNILTHEFHKMLDPRLRKIN